MTGCSMERREGAEYDFNEPMLENLIRQGGFVSPQASAAESSAGLDLVIAPLFLLPGKHAGAGGDIAEIIEGALEERRAQGLAVGRVVVAELVGPHPQLAGLLEARLRQVLAGV